MKILFVILCHLTWLFCYEVQSFDSKVWIAPQEKKIKNTLKILATKDSKVMNFSYPINENAEIIPILFSIKERHYKVYLKGSRVFFSIPDVKKGEVLEMSIFYKTLNNQKFLQVQALEIPKFGNVFEAKILIEVDKDWEVISQNPAFSKKGNTFTWEGKTQKFNDYFWLSIKQATWDIYVKNYVYTSQRIDNINLLTPKYFKNSDLKVKKILFNTNIKSSQIIEKSNNTSFVFRNARAQDFVSEMRAQVTNTIAGNTYKNFNPKDFLAPSPYPRLKELAQSIIEKSPNKPKHLALAQWVFETIKYNEKFTNKHMNSEDIIKVKNGVCEHYAQLYNDLLQAASIPSIFITGVGYNPSKRAFEYHAWNLVHVNGEWIPIDTTWGLFGGKLPVSHIFFYVGYQPLLMYETYDIPIDKTHTEVKQDIRFVP